MMWPANRTQYLGTLLVFVLSASGWADDAKRLAFFEQRIRPVLVAQCYECHNSAGTAEGGLALDYRAPLLSGGEHGAVIDVNDPDSSRLIKVLRHELEGLEMPQGSAALSPQVIQDFEDWIRDGAVDPRDAPPSAAEIASATDWETVLEKRKQWWSFQPIQTVTPPEVAHAAWGRQPVDRFVFAKLAAHGLDPNPAANRETLIRRLSYVLWGMPPTPAETQAFVNDTQPEAYARLVDRMLMSPHFGERWARHWMDWMRYAETHGSEGDPAIPHAWRYRDYLIRALNADVPYDQLVREHVAGDLLPEPRINHELGLNESLLGTAQYRFVQHGFAPTDALDELVRFTDNQVDVLTKSFLGLTVSCARCHNHKFDAISQTDFYALSGIMASCRPALVTVDLPERQALHRTELLDLKQAIRSELAKNWSAALQQLNTSSPSWELAVNAASESSHPLSVWRRLQALEGEAFKAEWDRIALEFAESQARIAARPSRWDLANQADMAEWSRHGNGLWHSQPSRPGGFYVRLDGDRLIDGPYPAGVYSHEVSTKHSGLFGSPNFSFDMQRIYVRVIGDGGARARYVVQNYPRRGTVYPVTELQGGAWHWVEWNLDYWRGDQGHLEISTAADQAVEANVGQDRSWFGISQVLFVGADEPGPREEPAEALAPLFALPPSTSLDQLRERYIAALTECVDAFGHDQQTDSQAQFLRYFVHQDLLPNSLKTSAHLQELVQQYRALEAKVPVPRRAPGIVEAAPRDQPLFVRGDHKQPGDPVPRRFLEALDARPYNVANSGRLALAESMLASENPLTARVIVNRVWHHVFGEGLVKTPDNFGSLGSQPSHPELLDWLAQMFVNGEQQQPYSLKQLVRALVMTETFQTTSVPSSAALELDPQNTWLSHWSLRRLDAESIRDALLVTTAALDPAMSGPAVGEEIPRRSVYVSQQRNAMPDLLAAFDAPVPFSSTGRRSVTNVPGQSLMLLNRPFVQKLANDWATRSFMEAPTAANADRISTMFLAALGRVPEDAERDSLLEYVQATRTAHVESQRRIMELQSRRRINEAALAELISAVRRRILAARQLTPEQTPELPVPLAAWEFEGDARDSIGELHGTLHGDARVADGGLILPGNGFMTTPPLKADLQERTLEVWVQLDNLHQRGGGVLTVQTNDGATFDSIVFAEQEPQKWLAGSNHFARTQRFEGSVEESVALPVHLAITFAEDGVTTAYRNGELYGHSYKVADVVRYRAGECSFLLGLRHAPPGGNRYLQGRILKARVFDRALSADEIAASWGGADYVSAAEIERQLTVEEGQKRQELQLRIAEDLAALQQFPIDSTQSPEKLAWRDLALTLLNLKEFIYLR